LLSLSKFCGRHRRREPEGDFKTGDRILLDPKFGERKAVDNVLATQVNNGWFPNRETELVQGDDVVPSGRILSVQSKRIDLRVDKTDICPPEDTIKTRIVNVPGKLLGNHADHHRL